MLIYVTITNPQIRYVKNLKSQIDLLAYGLKKESH